jgi:hypothetical protein
VKMKTRTRRLVSVGLATTLVSVPILNVYAGGQTQIAAAIGAEESKPAATTPSTTSPAKAPASPATTAPAPDQAAGTASADTSSGPELSQAQIWLGVGVAAFLAAVAGGGGGGSSSTSH